MPFPLAANLQRRHLIGAAVGTCVSFATWAQTHYPNRPVTLVVPFPPGGPTDASARLYAKVMGETLGQPFVIDNRPGAGGTVGSAVVARAAADGYTLLWGGTSTLAVAPGLYTNLKYGPQSFVPIGMALRGPLMLAAHPGAGVSTLKELLQAAKTQNFTVGTAGNESIGHLATELLSEAAGIPLTHVPYRGGAPAITDALSGQIKLVFDMAAALHPHVKAGKLRALAVTGAQSYAPEPNVPTVRAALGKDYEAYSWFGLVAPQGTPEQVMKRLSAAMTRATQSPEVRRELAEQGLEPGMANPHDFGAVIAADYKKWSGVTTRAKVEVE